MRFTNPAALILSIFVAGLLALYLWEQRRQRFDVPSLLFWESIPEAVARRNRFQPDLLFWLQLLALSAPILGLANPYLEGSRQRQHAKNVILILDTSASMAAVEEAGPRFDTAREEVRRLIESADPSTSFALIDGASTPVVLSDFAADHSFVLGLMEGLETRAVSFEIESALVLSQNISQRHDGSTEIHVFSDMPFQSVPEHWKPSVNWWPVGSTDDNLAIVGVDNTRPFLSSKQTEGVFVKVHNFSHREKHGALALRIDGRTVGTQTFTAPPHSAHRFRFSNISASGLLEASLLNEDALAVDNHWYSWIPPARPMRIALSSPSRELHAALERISSVSTKMTVAAIDIGAVAGLGPGDTDLIIVHRATLVDPPALPTLLIAPAAEPESQGPSTHLERVEIVDWDNEHSVLRGIDPHLLSPFQSTRAIVPPESSRTILTGLLNGREVPLLVTAGEDDHRIAIVGPDLPDEGLLRTDGEAALLLLLNLLDWLTQEADPIRIVRTGEARAVSSAQGPPIAVVDPYGRQVPLHGLTAPFITFSHAGKYELHHQTQPTEQVFANFLDIAESNIGRAPTSAHKSAGARSPRRDTIAADCPLKSWLYAMAALSLLLEWFLAGRTREDA